MKIYRIVAALCCLLCASCTFNGSLRQDFHSSEVSSLYSKTIPLRAVLFVEAKNIQWTGGLGIGGNISLRPGLDKAVQSELDTVFENTTLAKSGEDAQEGDVIVRTVLTHRVEVDHWNGGATVDWRLQTDFRDPLSKLPITSVESHGQTAVRPSGQTTLASFLTGFCLFICSPLTIPWMAQSGGNHAMEVLENLLNEELPRLPDMIRTDHKLLAFSQGERPSFLAGTPPPSLGKGASLTSDVDVLPAHLPFSRKNAHAVVIGIERHRNPLPNADFAERDARTVAKYLTKVLDYDDQNVALLLNDHATKSDVEKYIEGWLPDRVEQDDTVFIFFSGHGAPNIKNGKAYLVPFDGDPGFVEQTAYSLDRLYGSLAKLRAKEVVVILDSCFSGIGGRSVIAEGMRPIMLSVENPVLIRGNIVVIAASSGTQASATYKQQGHGLLTYYFLKGLKGEGNQNRDNRIELKELFEYLKPEVERTARREFHNDQTPQLLGNPEMLGRGVLLRGTIQP